MCARFTSPLSIKGIATFYDADGEEVPLSGGDRFPSHSAPIVIRSERSSVTPSLWGMLPKGVKSTEFWNKYSTFNAKSETLELSRLYKGPWENGQRCIIPVTAFTEWRGEKGKKQRLLIRNPDEEMTSIAGLWDKTSETGGFHTFTMLTTAPNEFMSKLHHRMPVILDRRQVDEWLNPDREPEELKNLFKPFEGELILEVAEQSLGYFNLL